MGKQKAALPGGDKAACRKHLFSPFQASLLAWIVTFSRHLLPRGPREQVYLVRNGEHTTTLTPVVGNEDGSAFAGSIFRRSVEVLAHKG